MQSFTLGNVLFGLIAFLFGTATLFSPRFRQLLKKRYFLFTVTLNLLNFVALFIGVIIFTGQFQPDANTYVEFSPWFIGFGLGTIFFNSSWLLIQVPAKMLRRLISYCQILVAFVATGLIVAPSIQVLASQTVLENEMRRELGANYETVIPSELKVGMLTSSFDWWDYFRDVGLTSEQFQVIEKVVYRKIGAVELSLDVYQPKSLASGKFPTLVVIHGGGWQTGDKTEIKQFNAYMATRGWVVFAIDYRLAPLNRYPAQEEDVQCALSYIANNATNYYADVNRLVLLGRSAGGTLALNTAYNATHKAQITECKQNLPKVRAVAAYYPPTNLADWYKSDNGLIAANLLQSYIGQTPDAAPEQYTLASPISHVTSSLPPTLLVQSGRDYLKLDQQPAELATRLRAQGNKAVLLNLPWACHGFDLVFNGISNRVVLYYTERFLAANVAKNL